MTTLKTKIHLYSNKGDLHTHAIKELGLSEKAADHFKRHLYQVEFDCVVDKNSGNIVILSIDPMDGNGLFFRGAGRLALDDAEI